MDFTGIIAEYDPFHNGHAAQLAAVRAAGAQCIAVCMSSGAVQRGGVPILPESVRVRAALDAGADLVVALPAPYACATAEQFAAAGVHLLAALGCDTLAFGAETPDAAALLDTARCQVTVYAPDDGNGYIIPYRTFICSPGKENSQTPTGTFKTTRKYRWHALVESTYGQYCTRLGNTSILFHSVPGKTTSIHNITAEEYNKLGAPASHGCIRMTVADCKWIYDHCPSGTVVTVGDNLPAPFDRPEAEKIPEGQDWDPTDPEIG